MFLFILFVRNIYNFLQGFFSALLESSAEKKKNLELLLGFNYIWEIILWSRVFYLLLWSGGKRDSRDIHEMKWIELGKGQYLKREDKDDSLKKKKAGLSG